MSQIETESWLSKALGLDSHPVELSAINTILRSMASAVGISVSDDTSISDLVQQIESAKLDMTNAEMLTLLTAAVGASSLTSSQKTAIVDIASIFLGGDASETSVTSAINAFLGATGLNNAALHDILTSIAGALVTSVAPQSVDPVCYAAPLKAFRVDSVNDGDIILLTGGSDAKIGEVEATTTKLRHALAVSGFSNVSVVALPPGWTASRLGQ